MAQKRVSKKRTIQEELEEIDSMDKFIREKVLTHQFKINCKFKNKKQKDMYNTIMNNRITFVNGVAGCGKTMVGLMAGLECIKNKDINISQIVLTKPIVEITQSKGLGALPGDLDSKTLVYFTHFYDNLIKLIGNEATAFLKESGVIKETVLNYLRGSTFGKYSADGKPIGTFCIFDECFTGDTKISTEINKSGKISKQSKISQIVKKFERGETINVISYNEKTLKMESSKVTSVFINNYRDILNIKLSGNKNVIKTTENHPFYVFENGEIILKESKEILPGDKLLRLKISGSNNSNILTSDSYDILLGFILGDGYLLKNKQKSYGYKLFINHGN